MVRRAVTFALVLLTLASDRSTMAFLETVEHHSGPKFNLTRTLGAQTRSTPSQWTGAGRGWRSGQTKAVKLRIWSSLFPTIPKERSKLRIIEPFDSTR